MRVDQDLDMFVLMHHQLFEPVRDCILQGDFAGDHRLRMFDLS